jgi:hypothetical protein
MTAQISTRSRILGLLAVAFLVVQLAVPAVALFGPRPSRFGWHMYSALPPVPHAWVIHADGSQETVDVTSLFVVPRAEIDYATALRDRLCAFSGAVEVRVQPDADAATEVISCR